MGAYQAWFAGPVGYYPAGYSHITDQEASHRFEFFGMSSAGELRRYYLHFRLDTRTFEAQGAKLDVFPAELSRAAWARQHDALVKLYRPIAVLRSDLPKGSLANALRGMLSAEDLAFATSRAMRLGR